ncbi:MAG: NAD(P)/FAD-dependent oxidoreductase [Aggregatilineales bacterium]
MTRPVRFVNGASICVPSMRFQWPRVSQLRARSKSHAQLIRCDRGGRGTGGIGGSPATGALKKMVTNGVMAVGDAAHQADPLTAGGINLSMIGADLASQVAVKALNKSDVSAKTLSEYERLWRDRFGRMHAALYQVRKLLSKLENDRLAALIRTASMLDIEHMSLGELFMGVMKNHPCLLVEARTLVTTGLLIK